jgi:hypothetical protein
MLSAHHVENLSAGQMNGELFLVVRESLTGW